MFFETIKGNRCRCCIWNFTFQGPDEAKKCAEEERAEVTRRALSHVLLLTAPEQEIVEKIKKLQNYLETTQDSGIYRIDASERLKNEFSCLGKMLYERYRG